MNETGNLQIAMRKNANLLTLISRFHLSFTDELTGEHFNELSDYNFKPKQKTEIMGKFKNAKKEASAPEAKHETKPEAKNEFKPSAPPPGYDDAIEAMPKRNFYKVETPGESFECILLDVEEIDFKNKKNAPEPVVVAEFPGVGEMLLPTHIDLIKKCEAVLEKYGSGSTVYIVFEGKFPVENGNTIARYSVFPQKKS